jgi:hypothetical protein
LVHWNPIAEKFDCSLRLQFKTDERKERVCEVYGGQCHDSAKWTLISKFISLTWDSAGHPPFLGDPNLFESSQIITRSGLLTLPFALCKTKLKVERAVGESISVTLLNDIQTAKMLEINDSLVLNSRNLIVKSPELCNGVCCSVKKSMTRATIAEFLFFHLETDAQMSGFESIFSLPTRMIFNESTL